MICDETIRERFAAGSIEACTSFDCTIATRSQLSSIAAHLHMQEDHVAGEAV